MLGVTIKSFEKCIKFIGVTFKWIGGAFNYDKMDEPKKKYSRLIGDIFKFYNNILTVFNLPLVFFPAKLINLKLVMILKLHFSL